VARRFSRRLSQTVALTGQPTAIALPLPPSGRIAITASDEGRGGGVTVGVRAGAELRKLPPMRVGQAFSLMVAVP
jgi:hypothetical protein